MDAANIAKIRTSTFFMLALIELCDTKFVFVNAESLCSTKYRHSPIKCKCFGRAEIGKGSIGTVGAQ
jgi:hypothetical protein